MVKIEKYIGKRVAVTDKNSIHFGRIGTLINVVNTEWYSQAKIAHVTLDKHGDLGSIAVVLRETDIAVLLPTNKGENE